MVTAYISLGTNLGNKLQNIKQALNYIETRCGKITRESSIYETAPWGFESNEKFLNQVVGLRTELTAEQLLVELLAIERAMGRTRKPLDGYASRIIDLDILFYDQLILEKENLKIPHPHIQHRKFILVPLMEIAASYRHPVFNKTIDQLEKDCTDHLSIKILESKGGV